MHKALRNIEEVPYCFSRSSIKFQDHARPVTAIKSLRFVLFIAKASFDKYLRNIHHELSGNLIYNLVFESQQGKRFIPIYNGVCDWGHDGESTKLAPLNYVLCNHLQISYKVPGALQVIKIEQVRCATAGHQIHCWLWDTWQQHKLLRSDIILK